LEFAVLSDTHINDGQTLPAGLWRRLSSADGILHAGDLTSPGFLADLRSLAPVTVVCGNCDCRDPHLAGLPLTAVAACGFLRVGLTHGSWGWAAGTAERAAAALAGEEVDIIIFGHSHVPYDKTAGGVRLFNPGSPTQRRGQPRCSYGWLTVTENAYRLEHVFI
jgi:putative phosphoesterase